MKWKYFESYSEWDESSVHIQRAWKILYVIIVFQERDDKFTSYHVTVDLSLLLPIAPNWDLLARYFIPIVTFAVHDIHTNIKSIELYTLFSAKYQISHDTYDNWPHTHTITTKIESQTSRYFLNYILIGVQIISMGTQIHIHTCISMVTTQMGTTSTESFVCVWESILFSILFNAIQFRWTLKLSDFEKWITHCVCVCVRRRVCNVWPRWSTHKLTTQIPHLNNSWMIISLRR